jgi:hypothetical protein
MLVPRRSACPALVEPWLELRGVLPSGAAKNQSGMRMMPHGK